MTKTDTLIEQAKAEAMKKGGWNPALETAIREGLKDGDVIHLGGELYAHIHGTDVAMVNDGEETARMALTNLSEAQRDRMLVLKGVRAGRCNYSIG
jgi:hypothetical protein